MEHVRAIQLKTGETVIFRNLTKADAVDMVAYLDHIAGESDYLTFGAGELSITVEAEEALIEARAEADNQLMIGVFDNEKMVGNLSFAAGSKPRIRHSGEFGISVLKAYWGKGIGTALLEYLIQWAEESNIIQKINLRVRSDNTQAIKVYEKFGFVTEGRVTREFFIDGQFYDIILMGKEING